MIKVSRADFALPPELARRSEAALRKLYAFFDISLADRLQRYIEFDSRIWREARVLLNDVFHGKCAYCETRIIGLNGEVELFRPKAGAIGMDRKDKSPDHYWWLAYEWNNLYLACRECNFNKANKFPVKGKRGPLKASLSKLQKVEKPFLLDPCHDDPEKHLAFSESGFVASSSERGRFTIEVLNLNRPSLVADRSREIEDIQRTVLLMLSAQRYSADELEKLMSPDRPYLAAKRQVMHRFMREQLVKLAPDLGKTETEKTLRQVKKDSTFISSAKQIGLEQAFAKEQQARENAPVTDATSAEFLLQRTQYITKIDISNFRVIERLTLEFPQQDGKKPWVILLGENGMGKSSILKAVALALMGEENHRALKLSPKMFLRRGCENGYVEVTLTGYTKPFRLDFSARSKEFQVSENKLHTLFFCYGGTRLMPTVRRRRRAPLDDYARINNLFDPFLPLLNTRTWLLGLEAEPFGFSARAVKQLLTQDEARELIRVPEKKPREVVLSATDSENAGGDTLSSLSDGYQSVIALAGDILEIMLKHYDEVRDSEGIVLIDEIDVHLHPRWKVEIVNLLRNVFPRVQFIVTTHDPLCLLGTLPGEVHVLRRHPETKDLQIQQVDVPPGTTADQVLTGFWFGLRSTLDEDTLAKLDRHRELLRMPEPETSGERREIEVVLRKRLGTFADTSIDRMAQSVASEVMQETTTVLTPEGRLAMRQTIKDKLLLMISEREKGG